MEAPRILSFGARLKKFFRIKNEDTVSYDKEEVKSRIPRPRVKEKRNSIRTDFIRFDVSDIRTARDSTVSLSDSVRTGTVDSGCSGLTSHTETSDDVTSGECRCRTEPLTRRNLSPLIKRRLQIPPSIPQSLSSSSSSLGLSDHDSEDLCLSDLSDCEILDSVNSSTSVQQTISCASLQPQQSPSKLRQPSTEPPRRRIPTPIKSPEVKPKLTRINQSTTRHVTPNCQSKRSVTFIRALSSSPVVRRPKTSPVISKSPNSRIPQLHPTEPSPKTPRVAQKGRQKSWREKRSTAKVRPVSDADSYYSSNLCVVRVFG